MTNFADNMSIVLCGEAGQGIQTIETLLVKFLKSSGFNVFSGKEYMSRVRGGSNSTAIRVSSKRIAAPYDGIDILIPLDKEAIPHLKDRISKNTVILGEKEVIQTDIPMIDVPFGKIALDAGDKIYANTVAIGVICGLMKMNLQELSDYIKQYFSSKDEETINKNIDAARKGFEEGGKISSSYDIAVNIKKNPDVKNDILLNGSEALALGAISGGCDFVSAYPMTPSTGVFTFLAKRAQEFGIIVEQAEDEISAVNMALGAWYAGARALVATSGGGFALMVEGLSLSGMLEVPLVIILGQRPGPATGLPTRTEQADLEFALYAGHGEFPRMVFAPGKLDEAFYIMNKSFNLADKFQTPVIVLTDQYFVDSYYNIPKFDVSKTSVEKHIIKTGESYKRYAITQNGISPRGIPGYGEGLVCVDSDEHDEEGHITEDLDLRAKMVEKRLRKLQEIEKEIIPPEFYGGEDYKNLIICWGSNYHIVKEAIDALKRTDTAMLHFKQIYPLHPDTEKYLKKSVKNIVVENNATAQFGKLLKLYTGVDMDEKILKYNGLSFTVDELINKLKSI